jgi:SpoVK/Ycf46/Vps4 family AAA+-type ATPase
VGQCRPDASFLAKAEPSRHHAPRGDLAEFLFASYPSERLNSVILPQLIGEELAHIVFETRMREKLEEKGLKPRRRILLSGPPGTGKTMSAHSLAGELQFPLFSVMLHGLITKFMGETAQKLKLVFDAIKSTRGVYLFDEIDALAATRGDGNDVGEARRVLNSFLQFLDEDTGPSIVIATTNLAEILDRRRPAPLRSRPFLRVARCGIDPPGSNDASSASHTRLSWQKVTDCAMGYRRPMS